jgi:hypothetical protein
LSTFAGFFLPSNSPFSLTYGGAGVYTTSTTRLTWSSVSVPEDSSLWQLLLVLAAFGSLLFLRKDFLLHSRT